jgi:hypothetical protein
VGRNIQSTITPILSIAEVALDKTLGSVTLEDVVKDILKKKQISMK